MAWPTADFKRREWKGGKLKRKLEMDEGLRKIGRGWGGRDWDGDFDGQRRGWGNRVFGCYW